LRWSEIALSHCCVRCPASSAAFALKSSIFDCSMSHLPTSCPGRARGACCQNQRMYVKCHCLTFFFTSISENHVYARAVQQVCVVKQLEHCSVPGGAAMTAC